MHHPPSYLEAWLTSTRFLWVALQIESICDHKTDEAIREALRDLPKHLSETFRHILLKAGAEVVNQRRILELIAAACRPLGGEELREVLSVIPGDTDWNPAKHINNIDTALSCCGSLVLVDEEELTVCFVHDSFRRFLLGSSTGSAEYHFTAEEANQEMGLRIITYLSYGGFESQISRFVVPKVPVKEVPSTVLASVFTRSSNVKGIAMSLLKSQKRPDFDIGKALAEASRQREHKREAFHFYHYAVSFFPQHTSDTWKRPDTYAHRLWVKADQRQWQGTCLSSTLTLHLDLIGYVGC
jgi:hypothetical protein